ncbi:MAG: DNA polymerase III subunit delta, partial [Gammaproteobacteria bacterium]|nr:DNA polymerase III subunit delta [Gammaproteobacteria bacterium]
LITLPKIDKSSQSTKWFKTLEQTGLMLAFYPIERTQLPRWIQHRLSFQQQKADTNTLQFFADKVEGNLLAAHQEIQKIGLLYPAGTLTFDQVKDTVLNVTRYDVYKLSDALVTADMVRYTRILSSLQEEGIAAPLIIAVLTEQIRTLISICKGIQANQPIAQIIKNTRLWGDRQKIMLDAAKRTGLQSLKNMLLHTAKIDQISKGITQGDVWNELSRLGLQLYNDNKLYPP